MRKAPTILLLLCLFVSNVLLAIPAKRMNQNFTQPDGSNVTIILQGDEHFSFYSTTDGVMLKKDNNGYMRYAVADTNGNLIPGKLAAQDPETRSAEATAYIKGISETRLRNAIAQQSNKAPMAKLPSEIGKSQFPNKGEVRGIIILAQFKDQPFSDLGTREEFSNMMNVHGYSNYNATGSAKDYFMDQSYNAFLPTFDVVGPVTLPQNMEYYGGNNASGSDKDPAQMIVDACNLADSQLGVNFAQYDYDNDGKVDLVYVIYAGYAEAQGGLPNTIWPHAWDIAYGQKSLKLDGKSIRNYACSSELRLNSGTELDGIGSFCHEFSHCLGLPDLYDSKNQGGYGLGDWDIMDSGCYNNDSRTPPSYSALERYSLSWLIPEFLETPQNKATLENLSTSNKAYFIKSDTNKDEFYTLENRQPVGWDKHLPGHGLIITHINYKPSIWVNNTVNTPKGKERVQIVPADNILSSKTSKADAFPGPNGNDSFTDTSLPAATLVTGGYLGKPVTNITEKDGIISFKFMGYPCVAPELKEANNVTINTFNAEWTAVEGATSYTLDVAPYAVGRLLISENFSGFKAGSQSVPDTEEISSNLDAYTQTKGWIGNEINQAGGTAYLGAESNSGYLTTPLLDLSNNTTFTLCVEAIGNKAINSGVLFSLINKQNAIKAITTKNTNLTTTKKKVYWVFSTNETAAYIRINSANKSNIVDLKLYSGDVKAQLENGETPSNAEIDQKQSIQGITTTNYNVTGLKQETNYVFSVRTIIDDEISTSSNKRQITTSDGTNIESTTLNHNVYVSGNQIIVSAQEGDHIEIYTIDGVLKYSFAAHQGDNNVQIRNGIYIVRKGNNSVKAIVTGK